MSEEADFKKAIQSYENTVGVNCRHTTHRTKRGTKGQTSQVIDMQLHEAVNYYTWYRIGCRKRTLIFSSFISGFAALDFTDFGGFQCLRWAEKLKLFLSSSVFMGSFSSYELFIIPRLDGVIHANSRFSNSKYSLFIFF